MLAMKLVRSTSQSGASNGATAAPGEPTRARGVAAMAGQAETVHARSVRARLTVTQGRHAGAFVDVKKPQVTIGSALSNSIVLTDTDVLPRHALISFADDGSQVGGGASNGLAAKLTARSKQPASTATIEAVDGSVLAGIQLIEAGQVIDVLLPCTLKFGGCALELTRPKAQPRASMVSGSAEPNANQRRRWIVPTVATLAGFIGLSLLGLYKTVTGEWAPSKLTPPRFDGVRSDAAKTAVATPALPPSLPPTAARASPATTSASAPATPVVEPAAAPAMPSRSAAAATSVAPPKPVANSTSEDRPGADLRQRLLAAGLDKTLSVERRGVMLVVDGIVSSATYARWRVVKDALASTPNALGTSVITDLVKTSTSANVPNNSVASVVLGNAPYVMSTNGRRARVGEILEDGWMVEAITADTVTMRRGQTVNRINPADGFSK
jgi:hypothetical protein